MNTVNKTQAAQYQKQFTPQISIEVIMKNLTVEKFDKDMSTTVTENSGTGGKLLSAIYDLCKLTFADTTKTEIIVKKSTIAEAIGMGQLYNYFSADAFQQWGVNFTPPNKKSVKAYINDLTENVKVSTKVEDNSKLEGIVNFEAYNNIAYKLWSVRGKAVVHSHIVKDKENSQFNKGKFGFTIEATDKTLTNFKIIKA